MKNEMKYILLGVLGLIVITILGVFAGRVAPDVILSDTPVGFEKPMRPIPAPPLSPELTQKGCEDAGGTWEVCGSACRGQEDAPCIEVCVPYCLCKTDAACPDSYACTEKIEGEGVCKIAKDEPSR